jgi:hypothetical protein
MYKFFLPAFIVALFFSAKLSAQKPNITYPVIPSVYLGKSITPIKVSNTGGAVPNAIFPKVSSILQSSATVTNFVRLPTGDIYGVLYGSVVHVKPDGTFSTLAGSGTYGYADGMGAAAAFGEIGGITHDAAGNIFVTEDNYRDGLNSRVRKITPDGLVTTYAQGLRAPRGIVIDANGIIYVAESAGRIMKVAKDGTLSLLAGAIGNGAKDGLGSAASFNNPAGIDMDKAGNLYVADYANNMIRKVTPAGLVTTIAGSTKNGSDDGIGAAATFNYPESIKIDSKGYIIVGDLDGLLRKISPAGEVNSIPAPYYEDNGQVSYQTFFNKVAIDENDNIIIYSGNGFSGNGFYKVSTTGYNVSPVLPAGLVLGGDGTISGTPTALYTTGKYKITASNATGMASTVISLAVILSSDPPVVNSFSPATGYPGTVISITGNFFTGTTGVTIGGKPADFYEVSPTSITAYVPTGASSGEISVTTPRGTAHLTGFTLIPPPVITAVSPTSGWKGNKITITGTGFSDASQVTFGGYYSLFKVISPTQIEAVLTDGASGDVYVSAPSGDARFSGFTYINAPVIASISPSSAGAGTTVTINGSDFSNATSVKFGSAAAASYTVVSPTKITAVVASGSSDGITVNTPAGYSNYYNFTFILPPAITQVSPIKGGNNSSITIYGSNLSGAQVTIGGVPASVAYNYGYMLTANVGAGASSGDITVATTGGNATYPGFVWVPAPHITSFSPQTAGMGDKVTITGTDLTEVDNVTFGDINCTFTAISPTTIEAKVGYGASGAVAVRSEGGFASIAGFTHTGPVITSFSPAHAGVGETVTITGSNFTNTTEVDFGGVKATSFTVISPTQISAVVGNGRSGNVTVTTPLGSAFLAGFSHPGPSISYFNPTYAGALTTSPITITGSNFTGATAVSFGGLPAASFTVVSATTITATPAATTSGNVMVTTPLGTDKAAGFTWVQAPAITSFSPSSQKSGGTVTITGTNFTGVTSVKFGGVPSYYYASSPTTIIATVNSGASGDIFVATAGGTVTKSGFTYTSPVITSIAPVIAAAGQTVVITGTNLDGVQSVKFGYTNAASFTIVSSKEIDAVVGTGASGTISVSGTAGAASIDGFTYLGPPVIYSFTPTMGGAGTVITINGANLTSTSEIKVGEIPATIIKVDNNVVTAKVGAGATGKVWLKTIAGTVESDGFTWYPAPTITSASPLKANAQTTVTINGTNFTDITELKFGSMYTNFTIVSPTQITAQPSNGESGDITLTGPGGTAVLPGFTFIPAPVIDSFTKSGEGANAVVTITGSNFTGVTEVKFGGISAASFTVLSSTSISAKPGSGATGAITIKAAGGSGTKLGYLYDSPPSISSFAPAFGPIGTTLAIEGDNFNTTPEKNIVFFGPVKAKVKSATKTHLEVTVPAGANDLITVVNTDKRLSASSNLPFVVTSSLGATSFSNRLDLKFNSGFSVLACNDFDGDGNPDLLITKADSIYILKHGSDPMLSKSSFLQKIVLQSERQALSVAIGDVDGDGKIDILYSTTPSIILLHNTSSNGNVSFEEKALENLEGTTGSMVLRDMNNDGRPDLVLYGPYASYCYANTTTGLNISFGPMMGLPNVYSSGTISTALADIDGDNKPDPIGGSSYTGITIFENNSVPGDLSTSDFPTTYFLHQGYYYTAWNMITADFDGDSKPDIVEDDFSGNQLLISRNTATKGIINASSLAEPKAFSNSSMTYNLNVADMNGDGKIDLLGSSNIGVYYEKNQSVTGNISLAGPVPLIAGTSNNSVNNVKINDMDGDGRMDIMLVNIENSTLSIYHNGPAVVPQITAVTPLTAKAGTKITITGKHFDGTTVVNFGGKAAKSFTVDSSKSIIAIVGEGETGAISIQTPNGTASFPGFVFVAAPTITSAVAATDGSGTLIINGSYFTNATNVTIAGIPASSFTVNSATKITATFPGISGDLTITTPGGVATLAAVTIKTNLNINFPMPANHIYGDADFLLSAVSNNNTIPVTFGVDKPDVVTITNGKLHILKAGTVTITASQAGDALNNAAVDVKRQLIINKKPLQVKAVDQSRIFGTSNPTLTIDYDGFIDGENKSSLTTLPVINTLATKQSPAGIYDITVAGATSDNYAFTYINGKLTITPAITNLKLAANSVTCKGQNNGSISITATQPASYTAVVTGNSLNKSYNFSNNTSIDNLSPGTYNVCVTDAALINNKQCFDLVITEPKDLAVYTTVNKTTNMVNVTLDGGLSYEIKLNGVSYKTSDNTITLPLSKGSNRLTVSTDKLCQGMVQQIIDISGITIPYPNPFQNVLNINIGEDVVKKATVKIYSLNTGVFKLSKDFTNQSGVISLDVSILTRGVYSLNLTIDGKESVYKIIKQ